MAGTVAGAVKAAKPSPKDGSYRLHAGDAVVTVTPSEKTTRKVVLDKDAPDE